MSRKRSGRYGVTLAVACQGNHPKSETREHLVGAYVDVLDEPQVGGLWAEVDEAWLSLPNVSSPRPLDPWRLERSHPGIMADLRTMALELWSEDQRHPPFGEDEDDY